MLKGYYLPIGLVNAIEHGLAAHVGRILHHVLIDVGHAVEGEDGASHEYGLRHKDAACEDVAGVGAEGIHNLLSLRIQQTGSVR